MPKYCKITYGSLAENVFENLPELDINVIKDLAHFVVNNRDDVVVRNAHGIVKVK